MQYGIRNDEMTTLFVTATKTSGKGNPLFSAIFARYTVLSYADGPLETSLGSGERSAHTAGPGFRHLPLSESTLLLWVYRFDVEDPYRPVPNEAALQFAPPAKLPAEQQALDVEAVGRRSRVDTGVTGVQWGPRDTGLLAWLWGGGEKGNEDDCCLGGGSSGGGRVRQHFVGSAAWQGRPITEQGRGGEEDDIQRAIALSLAEERGRDHDIVEVLDDVGCEETKSVER